MDVLMKNGRTTAVKLTRTAPSREEWKSLVTDVMHIIEEDMAQW